MIKKMEATMFLLALDELGEDNW